MNIADAIAYCSTHFAGLASIHGRESTTTHELHAANGSTAILFQAARVRGYRTKPVCADIERCYLPREADCPAADGCVFSAAIPYGCWIGFRTKLPGGGLGSMAQLISWLAQEAQRWIICARGW